MCETKVGPYTLGKLLGQGSSAKVYLAHDDEGKPYAIKMVDRVNLNPQGRRNLKREIQISKSLSHQNVMQLVNNFCHEHFICLVVEYCEESSIEKYLLKSSLPRPNKSKWTYELLNSVRYIHSKGVIHRDIKLDNIFLTKSLEVKLGDFGLSKYIDMAKTRCGTPYYMAPEVLGQGQYSLPADIWSAGVAVFKMMYGYYPFKAGSIHELIKQQKEKVEFPEEALEEEKELIGDMLEYEQSKRKNVDQLLEARFFQREELSEEMNREKNRKHTISRFSQILEGAILRTFFEKTRITKDSNDTAATEAKDLTTADDFPEETLIDSYDCSRRVGVSINPTFSMDSQIDTIGDGTKDKSDIDFSLILLYLNLGQASYAVDRASDSVKDYSDREGASVAVASNSVDTRDNAVTSNDVFAHAKTVDASDSIDSSTQKLQDVLSEEGSEAILALFARFDKKQLQLDLLVARKEFAKYLIKSKPIAKIAETYLAASMDLKLDEMKVVGAVILAVLTILAKTENKIHWNAEEYTEIIKAIICAITEKIITRNKKACSAAEGISKDCKTFIHFRAEFIKIAKKFARAAINGNKISGRVITENAQAAKSGIVSEAEEKVEKKALKEKESQHGLQVAKVVSAFRNVDDKQDVIADVILNNSNGLEFIIGSKQNQYTREKIILGTMNLIVNLI